jgi:iron complex outermembrane receptor protein
LGKGATLVLIDGRRTITSAFLGAQGGFDLNSIPLAAVDRIEVLSDSASAIYGADAVGGVVNVILKKNIESPSASFYYGGADGGADETRASLAAGLSGDRFRVSATLDYLYRDFLMGSQRDRSANADFRRFGATDFRVATADPGNILSATAANLPGCPAHLPQYPTVAAVSA